MQNRGTKCVQGKSSPKMSYWSATVVGDWLPRDWGSLINHNSELSSWVREEENTATNPQPKSHMWPHNCHLLYAPQQCMSELTGGVVLGHSHQRCECQQHKAGA